MPRAASHEPEKMIPIIVSENTEIDPAIINRATSISTDDIRPIVRNNIGIDIEDEYSINIDAHDFKSMKTVGELIDYVQKHLNPASA